MICFVHVVVFSLGHQFQHASAVGTDQEACEPRLVLEAVFAEGWVDKDTMKELYRQLITCQRPFSVALENCQRHITLDPVRMHAFGCSPRRVDCALGQHVKLGCELMYGIMLLFLQPRDDVHGICRVLPCHLILERLLVYWNTCLHCWYDHELKTIHQPTWPLRNDQPGASHAGDPTYDPESRESRRCSTNQAHSIGYFC